MSTEKKIKFEDALKQLEKVVHELESDEPDLDKAIKLYEKGIDLSKYCTDALESAEQKIEKIQQDRSS